MVISLARRFGVIASTSIAALGLAVVSSPSANAALPWPDVSLAVDNQVTGEIYEITINMRECDLIGLGTQGTCVRSLQTWLNIYGPVPVPVTGYFGSVTRGALVAFQRAHGIAADGVAGEEVREAIGNDYYFGLMDELTRAKNAAEQYPVLTNVTPRASGEVESGVGNDWAVFVACAAATTAVGVVLAPTVIGAVVGTVATGAVCQYVLS